MNRRKSDYPVHPLFLERWSPRAMSGESITHEELMSLFEAARWAPSSYNNQPWSFIYAKRDSKDWDRFFNLLVPFNQSWCYAASALVVVVARTLFFFNDKPSRTYALDTGMACENLALQGSLNGLVIHGMEGFDYDAAKKELNIPDEYEVQAMYAIGKPGSVEDLPTKELQEREKMSDRKPITEFIFEGMFKK